MQFGSVKHIHTVTQPISRIHFILQNWNSYSLNNSPSPLSSIPSPQPVAATSFLSGSRSLTTLGTSYKWDGSYSICLLVTGLFHLEYPQRDFPDGSAVEKSASNAGYAGLAPGSGSSPGWGNGNPLQYSCLENPMDRGARQSTAHGVTKSWPRLNMHRRTTQHPQSSFLR